MLERGTIVAGYRIDGVLGDGGMGVVYRATQLSLDREVALKLLSNDLGDDSGFRIRFQREGQLQAALDHDHIVPVFEAGQSEHGLFLAMRMIDGPTLKDLILAGELDPRRSLRLLAQAATALDTAHAAGLIHRDIKPQNILVDRGDHAYLADFGLIKAPDEAARLTGTGQFIGTIDYVAPEQIQGDPASAASDIYALTGVLYETLTGEVPFPRPNEAATLHSHVIAPPPRVTERRPDLPATIDERGRPRDGQGPRGPPTVRHRADHGRLARAVLFGRVRSCSRRGRGRGIRRAGHGRARAAGGAVPGRVDTRARARAGWGGERGGRAGCRGGAATRGAAGAGGAGDHGAGGGGGRRAARAGPCPCAGAGRRWRRRPSRPCRSRSRSLSEPELEPPVVEPDEVAAAAPAEVMPEEPEDFEEAEEFEEPDEFEEPEPVPVPVVPEAAAPEPAPEPAPAPARVRRPLAALVLVALAGAAGVGGYLLGHTHPRSTTVAYTNSAAVNHIQLRYPAAWELSGASAVVPGMSFDAPVVLSRPGRPGQLIAGTDAGAGGSSLLSPAFRARVQGPLPRPDTVRLGTAEAYRYSGLQVRGLPGPVDVYAVPTSAGVATIACAAPAAPDRSFASDCSRIAATLRLIGVGTYPLGPSPAFAAVLSGTFGRLTSDARGPIAALGAAKTASVQAATEKQLSAAYGAAADRLGGAAVPPNSRDVRDAIVAALRRCASAYGAAASAVAAGAAVPDINATSYNVIRARAAAAYRGAQGAVAAAAAGLSQSLRALSPLGYTLAGQR